MDMDEAVRSRHSVRQYIDRQIDDDVLKKLQAEIDAINEESGLKIIMMLNEPKAFGGMMLKSVMKFKGAVNYFSITAKDAEDTNVKVGYYGERLVLFTQMLGLNTCWAMMAKKDEGQNVSSDGYKPVISISFGYGENQGVPHKNKPVEKIADLTDAPEWFSKGVEYAMMAPTGVNRQGFRFERDGDKVRIIYGSGTLPSIDAGIVKYHFEQGAGTDNFTWVD